MGTTMADCGPATRDLIARLTSQSRNRYYYGKLLDAYHLELEQGYGNWKRWMLNRLSLGAGVLCGIGVRVSSDRKRVRITSGVAIDYYGREIIVPQDSRPFDPTQPTDECGDPVGDPIRGGTVTLFLCYHECESEPAPAMVDECGESGCENGIILERYRLRVGAGTPVPPGTITEAQCKRIFETPPDNVSRRTVVCRTLGGQCGSPDDSCIPIATLDIRDGAIRGIDTCTFRPNVYSNAVLLDLILCLAERVDECCGPVAATATIEIVSGNNQAAPAGQMVANPLVARVTLGGAPLANEAVTFDVTDGGGSIGANAGSLSSTFTTNTNGAGDATLPAWRLGPTAGSFQRVKAGIASGASVAFEAKAEQVPVGDPPVVRAIWPPNGVQLQNAGTPEVRKWFREFRDKPRLQITFDRKMRQAQLQAPEPWLRMYALAKNSGNFTTAGGAPINVIRLAMAYSGTESSPILNVSGVTEQYVVELPIELQRLGPRYLVQIKSQGSNIVEASPPGLLLDAEFGGSLLTIAQLDQIWPVTGLTPSNMASFNALATGPDTLPQSGDGTPGGRFHSWFEVIL